jgi:hypothetical protein
MDYERKCYELAEHFMDEALPEPAKRLLAQHIQEAIDGWIAQNIQDVVADWMRGYEADLAHDEPWLASGVDP